MIKSGKRWEFFPEQTALAERLARHLQIPAALAGVLVNRGVDSEAAADAFLHAGLDALHDPFLLKDMRAAVDRARRAIDRGEKITVFGDYDVDGITATALTARVLKALGAAVDYYIPERQSEGYGLNRDALESLAAAGVTLVVTVDCGVTAADEAAALRDRLDIIITDHHEPPAVLPAALAVLNPKRADGGYPDKNLAGVGVAYKFCQALWREIKGTALSDGLELAAVGTVADIVPLTGENRVLTRFGLERLRRGENLGLRELCRAAGQETDQVGAGTIGFVLGPRLNAAGRLGSARAAVRLLLTDDAAEAASLAASLDEANRERQAVERDILARAERELQAVDIAAAGLLVPHGDGWHSGVIGIVASRLVEKYYKPAVVISLDGDVGKGSCRSIPGFDMYGALKRCDDLLLQYGGHRQAAGLTVEANNIAALTRRLNEIAGEVLQEEDYIPRLSIDAAVDLAAVDDCLLERLAALEPFGMGNPRPVFCCRGASVAAARAMGGEGRHLKLQVRQGGCFGECVAWNQGGLAARLPAGAAVDIAFQAQWNEWRGRRRIQLNLQDIREGTPPARSELDQLFDQARRDGRRPGAAPAESFFTKIAGVTFAGRQSVAAGLRSGQTLLLRRRPENPHDGNAIEVTTADGRDVGFLRRGLAADLAAALDGGGAYQCTVADVTGGGDRPYGVNVELRAAPLAGEDRRPPRAAANEETVRRALIGEHAYHDGQRRALAAVRAGRNVLAIMGTGRGKSAIFQTHAALTALNERRMTVILYPLRALVNDQYESLRRRLAPLGLGVYKGSGALDGAARTALLKALAEGGADILLATPEFLEAHLPLLADGRRAVGFLVVDECHHIAGKRPAYRRLREMAARLGRPPVLAVTATADEATAAAIEQALAIETRLVDETARDNLAVADARRGVDKDAYLADLVKQDAKTLIFVNSRKKTVQLAETLRRVCPAQADRIGFYHAGLDDAWRLKVETWFRDGALRVVAATSAFGEGVDLPDIRHVVLYHLPFSRTAFNQQCGRAGRDGRQSMVHLLFGNDDSKLNALLLMESAPERERVKNVYLLLKKAARTAEAVEITNAQLADELQAQCHMFASEGGVGVCLKILEEIGLIWRETAGARRTIYLQPPPARKLSLTQSLTYDEGRLEREAFDAFAREALQAAAEDILSWINRPLYPAAQSER